MLHKHVSDRFLRLAVKEPRLNDAVGQEIMEILILKRQTNICAINAYYSKV